MNARQLYCGPMCRVLCVLMSIVMATGPSAAVMAQQPAEEPPAVDVPAADQLFKPLPARGRVGSDTTLLAAPEAGKIDLKYVPPQAVFLAVAHPAQVLRAPGSEMLPHEVITAAGLEHLGFDPADVSEVVVFVGPPMGFEPGYGMAVKFLRPFAGAQLPEKLRAHTQPGEVAGRRYLQSTQPQLPSFYMPNDRTLLVAPDASLLQMLAVSELGQTSALFERVRSAAVASDLYAVIDIASLRPLLAPMINMAVMQQGERFPAEARPFLEVPQLVNSAELTATLSGPGPSSFVVHGDNEAAAEKLDELIGLAMNLWQEQLKAEMAKGAASDDPVERAAAAYSERLMGMYLNVFRPAREGSSLVFFRTDGVGDPTQRQLTNVAVIGILVALLLPAIQAAREAARRNQSMNNLKQLMLSLHNYADTRKMFPAHASYSEDGKPLLSWRVHVLPFLEETALYNQFHLDEPWDSEHNRTLIERMPAVLQNPNLDLETGKTNYLAIVGSECVFDGTAKGIRFTKITDGTSKTVMLVEADADQAVIWTKPDDFEHDANNPTAGLGGLRAGGWLAGFADGSVQFITNDIDQQVIKALFTRAGGEVIGDLR